MSERWRIFFLSFFSSSFFAHLAVEMENPSPVNTAALHPNQVELIYGDQSGSLKVWDLRTNTCTRALVPSGKVETPLRSISISANGKRVVAANNKGQVFVWRLGGEDTSMFDAYTKVSIPPPSFFFTIMIIFPSSLMPTPPILQIFGSALIASLSRLPVQIPLSRFLT